MTRVVMLVHEEGGTYGASFPDFPGATTVAGDLDTLYCKASEALAFHVSGITEDGDDIPAIRTIDQLRRDPMFRKDADGALIALIDVELPGRAVRVNVSIDENLLKRIDRAAEAAGESRSGFLAQAAMARLSNAA